MTRPHVDAATDQLGAIVRDLTPGQLVALIGAMHVAVESALIEEAPPAVAGIPNMIGELALARLAEQTKPEPIGDAILRIKNVIMTVAAAGNAR